MSWFQTLRLMCSANHSYRKEGLWGGKVFWFLNPVDAHKERILCVLKCLKKVLPHIFSVNCAFVEDSVLCKNFSKKHLSR